jgi:hypothetical protein
MLLATELFLSRLREASGFDWLAATWYRRAHADTGRAVEASALGALAAHPSGDIARPRLLLRSCPALDCRQMQPGRNEHRGLDAYPRVVLPNSRRLSCLFSCILTVPRANESAGLLRCTNYYGLDSNDNSDLNHWGFHPATFGSGWPVSDRFAIVWSGLRPVGESPLTNVRRLSASFDPVQGRQAKLMTCMRFPAEGIRYVD